MTYDWRDTMEGDPGTKAFFQEIDDRFFSSSPFYEGPPPFSEFMPITELHGKRVLEIGCGMGSHAELLARAGAKLIAVDLTEPAVRMTESRLQQRGLDARVVRLDAEQLPFADGPFDLVWSWGVIHHSANTEAILDEVRRVLRDGGELRVMVYHRRSVAAWVSIARGALSGKFFRRMSVAEVLSYYSDGSIARFYTRNEFHALLRKHGLIPSRTVVLGQTSELVPIPGRGPLERLKKAVVAGLPLWLSRKLLSRWGAFLFVVCKKPRNLNPG
jgi:ubiquinone/menaquinone biosynthesis C-methylase UbiE